MLPFGSLHSLTAERIAISLATGLPFRVIMRQIAKNSDDIARIFGRKIGFEAQRFHAGHQSCMVGPVAGGAGSRAAFGFQFMQRLMEGKQRMRRRREAELTVQLHIRPLGVKNKAEGGGASHKRLRRAKVKPNRGTPWMHLLDEEIRKSQ
jgi:hypothetical protein